MITKSKYGLGGRGALSGVSQLEMVTPSATSARESAKSRQQREAGSTAEVPLSAVQMFDAWNARSHPFARMCINEITKRLFAGAGIVALSGDRPRRPSAAFSTYLQRDMAPFARDALDAILSFGVVPIAFRRPFTAGLGERELAPFVPRFGTYTITTWSDRGMQRFAFYWRPLIMTAGSTATFGEYDETVLIAHDFGFDPNLNGTLTSNMATVAYYLRMAGELSELACVAERIASNPPLIMAYNSDVDKHQQQSFGQQYFVSSSSCQRTAERRFELNAEQRARATSDLKAWCAANPGIDPREHFGALAGLLDVAGRPGGAVPAPPESLDFGGAVMPWARQWRMEASDAHVNHPLPRARGDYTAVMSQIMDIVCGVLNVPRGLLASESHVRAGVEATAEAMHRTVNRYADMLSALMTGVYDHIFGNADLRDELRIRIERKRRSPLDLAPQLLTESDLFEAVASTRVRLTFDLPPATTQDSLNFLYNRGILSWLTYSTSSLRLNGFSRDELAAARDPLTQVEQRLLLLGKPPTTQSSGADAAHEASHEETQRAKKASSKADTSTKKPSDADDDVDSSPRASKKTRKQ